MPWCLQYKPTAGKPFSADCGENVALKDSSETVDGQPQSICWQHSKLTARAEEGIRSTGRSEPCVRVISWKWLVALVVTVRSAAYGCAQIVTAPQPLLIEVTVLDYQILQSHEAAA